VLGPQEDVIPLGAEVEGAVGPGVEVPGASQSLTGRAGRMFSHVMDHDDGEVVPALQFPEKGQEFGHLSRVIFIAPMESDQRIEQEQSGPDPLYGVVEPAAIEFQVEPQAGCGDDVQGDLLEEEPAMPAKPGQALSDTGGMIFGQVDEHLSRITDFKGVEAGRAGGDGEGEIEPEPGFAQLGLPGHEADRGPPPEWLDQPRRVLLEWGEISGPADRERFLLEEDLLVHGWTGMRT
jgi:hypothetical protein